MVAAERLVQHLLTSAAVEGRGYLVLAEMALVQQ
jgi:hypothetical protein